MPTPNQIEALAMSINAIRPDWPVRSLITYFSRNHADRPFQHLAVAMAWIATDPTTQTPKRVEEHGPWWAATATITSTEGRRRRCPDHPDQPLRAGHCPRCAAAFSTTPPRLRDLIAQLTPEGA